MSKLIRVGGAAPNSVLGLPEVLALFEDLPDRILELTNAALSEGADDLVSLIKAAAPVSELEAHPGELRDSVHREQGRHELQVRVVEDAGLSRGDPYAAHVEYGHKAKDGSHVAAIPHFWPSVRVARKKLQQRIAAAVRKAVRTG